MDCQIFSGGGIFHLNYLYRYALEILEVYEYGMEFIYTYQDNILPYITNTHMNTNKRYVEVKKILNIYLSYNLKIKFKVLERNRLYSDKKAFYGEIIDNMFSNTLEVLMCIQNDSVSYKKVFDLMLNDNMCEAYQLLHKSNFTILSKLQSGVNNYVFTEDGLEWIH